MNVTVRHADGRVVPCELVYLGTVPGDDGVPQHEWGSATPIGPGDDVFCDALPPRTSIRFAAADDDGAG